MNNRIYQLPVQLANQIAAGEVVERPASVVKELLENSLDASPSRIQIDIEKGGARLIRVRDDGAGIHKEDLPLALQRHATSKIRDYRDLQAIVSLGFRGEALASISSVSRLKLASKAEEASQAWQVQMAGEAKSLAAEPTSHPQGSTVEVRDLFFNTPARRKFLRSEKTEFLHIEEVVKRQALSQFSVGFLLRHNQRLMFNLRPAKTEEAQLGRLGDLCGRQFARFALPVEYHAVGMRLYGWLGTAECARSQTDTQYFFINGRVIRDRLINHAIRQAYQELLHEGRHPCYVLYLEIDPQTVDVNVHPTKHEVRFHQSRLVHDFIFSNLYNTLNGDPQEALGGTLNYVSDSTLDLDKKEAKSVVDGEKTNNSVSNSYIKSFNQPLQQDQILDKTLEAEVSTASVASDGEIGSGQPSLTSSAQADVAVVSANSPIGAKSWQSTPPSRSQVNAQLDYYQKTQSALVTEQSGQSDGSAKALIGQFYGSYLIMSLRSALHVVHINNAKKHIAYHRLAPGLQGEAVVSQPLLLPASLTLSEAAVNALTEAQVNLQQFGLYLEATGPRTVVVRQLPAVLRGTDVSSLIETLAVKLLADSPTKLSAEQLLNIFAKSAAVKSGETLNKEDLNKLINELESISALEQKTPLPPYSYQLSTEQLANYFKE